MRLLTAGSVDTGAFLQALRDRSRAPTPEVEQQVRAILEDVRQRRDAALFDYTQRFDGIRLDAGTVRVSEAEMAAAVEPLDPAVRAALELAAERIEAYHYRQRRESWFYQEDGAGLLGQLVRPLRRVGLYVPGGSAAYPSTVLMSALPARVAGVGELVETELRQPRPLREIVAGVTDPNERATLYVLAFSVLRGDEQPGGAERIYLAQLANLLGLDPAEADRLEKSAAASIDRQQ